jgi:putative salt-induced outer membrane protein YdiY
LGYQWQEGPVWNFSTEGGIAYVYKRYDDDDADPEFDNDDSYIAVRGAYHYDRKLNDNLLLFHNFEIIPSVEDPVDVFTMTTDLGLRANMTANMFTETRVELKHDSEPAAGSSKSDLKWIVSIGWAF